MTKTEIEKRLADLEAAIQKQQQHVEQQAANLNMLLGGKQECLYWLKKLTDEVRNDSLTIDA